jgi:four helix bundle protein
LLAIASHLADRRSLFAISSSTVSCISWSTLRASVGANLEEAGDGQTKPDFRTKNAIALKEVREAKFWLRQLRDAEPKRLGPGAKPLIEEAEELRRIVTAIIINSKESESRGEAR